MKRRRETFFHEHSLTLVATAILVVWIVLYTRSDPQKHGGAFFGNAIADWSGVVLAVVATKYFFEKGSAETRPVPRKLRGKVREFLVCHSFTLFLLVTGTGWLVLYLRMDPASRWGQVVGNILSEWVQITGLVLLTKKFFEKGSRESRGR